MDKRAEAIKRMEMLNLLPNVIEEFKEGTLELSERLNAMFPAVLYWVENDTYNTDYSLVDAIKTFESDYEALVYHVQLTHTEYGDLYAFFYVSDDEEEWESDRKMLEEGRAYCYVWDATDPWCSEIGSIGFRSVMGGVERTW